jgi:hypothetical protein
LSDQGSHAINAKGADRIHGPGAAGQEQGRGVLPEMAEEFGVARHGRMEDFTDLATQSRRFADEVAAMATPCLELLVSVGPSGLQQTEAVDGDPKNGRQVGVIGFVAWVSGLAILLRGVRMHQAHFGTGFPESALDGAVIFTRTLNGHDVIPQVVLCKSLADAVNRSREISTRVPYRGWLDENFAVEIGKHVAGSCLGTVDANNAKVLRTNNLNTVREATRGLGQKANFGRLASTPANRCGHECSLQGKGLSSFPSWSKAVGKPKYQFF